ncbi:VC0807 family protein [Streptomyces sp. CRN 30]|uniref:VC0807 family protein n=1 Tax=Streptomyces sp. CRN 30 TaxID=3075613 RepID=UPI002A816AB3|nr:VC0807 family protein [Streptomyces sp. CRN 30]
MTTNKDTGARGQRQGRAVVSLLLDVAVPLGSFYLLKGCGLSTLAALGWSSAITAARTGWGLVRRREVNGLPLLILLVNVVGLVVGLESGDARLMLVKDSAIGSVVGIALLVSVVVGRPMMTANVRPWLVRGDAGRDAAWGRLRRESGAFRRAELRFTAVWGLAFLGECVLRIVGAYSLPVDTMVWLGTVVMIVVLCLAFVVSGAIGAGPMMRMVMREAYAAAPAEAEADSSLAGSTAR